MYIILVEISQLLKLQTLGQTTTSPRTHILQKSQMKKLLFLLILRLALH